MKRHPCCFLIPLLCGWQEGKNHPPPLVNPSAQLAANRTVWEGAEGPAHLERQLGAVLAKFRNGEHCRKHQYFSLSKLSSCYTTETCTSTHRNNSDPTASAALRTTGASSTCLPAPAPHMLLHPFTSHTVSFPQRPQHRVVPQWAANPPAGTPSDTFPSKASALCEQAQPLCPTHTFPLLVCLFQF